MHHLEKLQKSAAFPCFFIKLGKFCRRNFGQFFLSTTSPIRSGGCCESC